MCRQPLSKACTFPWGGTMKRTKAVVLSMAILFALSGYALARDHDNDNDQGNRGKKGYQAGYDRGYQDGKRAGWDDRNNHRGNNAGRIDDDRGYDKGDGARGQYKKGYREG